MQTHKSIKHEKYYKKIFNCITEQKYPLKDQSWKISILIDGLGKTVVSPLLMCWRYHSFAELWLSAMSGVMCNRSWLVTELQQGADNGCHYKSTVTASQHRDHFVYAPSQWETTLQCNVVPHWLDTHKMIPANTGIILCMCPANERQRYNVTSPLIGWAHTKWSLQHHQHKHTLDMTPWILGPWPEDTNMPRAHSRFAPCQWETALLCNDVSHWLGASLESALHAKSPFH